MDKKEGYKKYKNQIELMSERWNMSQELICAFCYQESRFEEKAKRYEPAFYKKYVEKFNIPQEEKTWRATSWGLMQLMGQTAREIGYRGYRDDLVDPIINLYYCCKFFIKLLNRYKGSETDAIAAYNQGNNRFKDLDKDGIKDENEVYNNQKYVDNVLKYEKEFNKIINENNIIKEDSVYVVKSGDTLTKIANSLGTTTMELSKLNGIKNPDFIYIGQKIRIK